MFKKIVILSIVLQALAHAEVLIPEQIKVPMGYQPIMVAHGVGDQIYQCSINKDRYLWEVLAPDAALFDKHGNLVGKHSQGPIWEYKQGSKVVGRVVNKIASTEKTAISWLLVEVVSHQGDGLFSKVSFINRINTHGGLPPESGCDSNHLGSEKRIAYTADYIFYGK